MTITTTKSNKRHRGAVSTIVEHIALYYTIMRASVCVCKKKREQAEINM